MKPLKETKIGKFLSGKGLDHLLEGVGDLVPGAKILDRIKDAVLGDSDKLNEEDKKQFMEIYRLNLEEFDKELANTAGARARERNFVTATGHIDWFMTVFGMVMLLCYVFTVVVSALGTIPEGMREIFIESRAAARDVMLGIAGYYWGSSAGSRIKDMKRE